MMRNYDLRTHPEVGTLTGEEMRRLFFVDLVRAGRLSHTKAAELLEVSQAEFLAFMALHRISPFAFAEGELETELERVTGMGNVAK